MAGKAFCKICCKSLENNITHLDRHEKFSKYHFNKLRGAAADNTLTLEQCYNNSAYSLHLNSKIEAEVICVMYCIQHNLPVSQMDFLPKMIKILCKDSKIAQNIKCGRTKATSMINQVIGPYVKQDISKELRQKNFSLIIDETTDVSTSKCLVLITRHFHNNLGQIVDQFFGLIEVKKSDAEEIFTAIKEHFKSNKIPFQNIIGLASDNAAVMSGNITGVKTKFQNENKDIFFLGCTCHSLHLCASAACKVLPSYIEKVVKNIYNHFSHSPKRVGAFKEFQEYFDVNKHKILGVSSTRWLSLEQVVNRVLEQWEPLMYYFQLYSFEELNSSNAGDISDFLTNPSNKLYMLFLSYILNIINENNKIFQSEFTKIHLLDEYMRNLYTDVLKNFIKLENVNTSVDFNDSSLYLDYDQMYFGLKFEDFCLNAQTETSEILNIKRNLVNFYVELCTQIRKRFDFGQNKTQLLKFLDMKEIVTGKLPTILPILRAFPFHKVDEEQLNIQWRSLIGNKEILEKYYDPDITKFWSHLKTQTNALGEFVYEGLASFMLVLCSLPHSSASAERKFSTLNLIKTEIRNRLNTSTVENMMFCKELIRTKENIWEPSNAKGLIEYFKKFHFVDGEYKQRH